MRPDTRRRAEVFSDISITTNKGQTQILRRSTKLDTVIHVQNTIHFTNNTKVDIGGKRAFTNVIWVYGGVHKHRRERQER